MTRNNTSYRGKGRALFLAALMILSVIAVPFAFAGGAAALNSADNAGESYDREVTNGQTIFQGQKLVADVSGVNGANSDLELRQFNEDGDSKVGGLVAALDVTSASPDYTIVDTENRNTGQYVITTNSSGDNKDTKDIEFEIVEQDVSATFDDGDVADTGTNAKTSLDVSSDTRNNYAINVTADGLDAAEIASILNTTGQLGTENSSATSRYDVSQYVSQFGPANEHVVLDDDGEVLTIYNGEQDFNADFDGIDTGEYDFNVEVVDTTASDSDMINVSDEGDGSVDFADGTVEAASGDIAEITLTADNTDKGTLVIGNEDDVGYQANVSVDFDDLNEVTVYFNTYAAGNDSLGNVVWLDSDDKDDGASITFDEPINQTTGLNAILESGDYELTASAATSGANSDYTTRFGRTVEEPDSVGSLFIEERSTNDVNIWTASTSNVDELLDEDADDQVDAVKTAIENDQITESDAVAHDDYAIHQIDANGLEGLFEYAESEIGSDKSVEQQLVNLTSNTSSRFTNADGDSALQLRVRETQSSVGPNAPRGVVDIGATAATTDAVKVLYDEEGDQYFVLLETDSIVLETGGSLAADEDYEFDVQFQVRDGRLLEYDSEEDDDITELYQTANTEHDIVERDGDFDLSSDDLIEVEADSGQEITGTTNIAPGSEVRVRLRGTGDARFSQSQSEIVVNSDGTFAGEFDFSDRDVDDEFTATLSSVVTEDDDPEENGIVIEAVEEPEGEEPPATNETDETSDDDGNVSDDDMSDDDMSDDDMSDDSSASDDSTDDSADDSTEEETPGFGALVALVAVLGAALLASRRQN